jgi:hypothetical protein
MDMRVVYLKHTHIIMPEIGNIKKVKRFAILPVRINNDYIWFRKYVTVYEYREVREMVLLPFDDFDNEFILGYDMASINSVWLTINKWVELKKELL